MPTGEVDPAKRDGDSAERIVRPAILVHAGANGAQMVFQSADGDIAFDEDRIKRIIENQNQKIIALAEQYGGIDKMPAGAFPPVLDQHADDSNNRVVGRFASLLRFEKRDVPKVGKNVPCAVADLSFLGADTVSRVHDGRIYHLSIGIDEETDTLGEVSTVIEPAAPGAMLLKNKPAEHKRLKQGEKNMPKQMSRIKAAAKRMATLAQMSEGITKLSKELKSTSETIKLTRKEGDVTHRLMKLMQAGKMTPAEYKKLSVKKLAALPEEALDTVVESYNVRETQINPIQKGSSDAIEFAELAKGMKKKQIKNLASETIGDLKRMTGGKIKFKSLAFGDDEHKDDKDLDEMSGPKEEEINPGKDPHAVPGEGGDKDMAKLKHHMAQCAKHLAEGNVEKAKEHHDAAMAFMSDEGDKHLSLGMGDVKSEDYQKGMSSLESRVDELSTQMARFAGMVSELMDVEKEEGHELAADDEKDDDEKKKLAAEIDDKEKK